MIVSDKDRKSVQEPELKSPLQDEPPPTYSPSATSGRTSQSPSSASTPSRLLLPKVKPCNYLTLTRDYNAVKGAFVVDPALRIPPSVLALLADGETEETRKNLTLASTHGSVDVTIYLTTGEHESSNTGPSTPRTTMCAKSQHGWVTARLHVHTSGKRQRAPFHLHASSVHGPVTVHIPRDFHGLLTISTPDAITLSHELSEVVTTFGEADNVRRCFVGDLEGWADAGVWTGDEVTAETKHGRIKVQFVDEVKSESPRSKGFFGRVLGL